MTSETRPVRAVLFDFGGVVGTIRPAFSGEPGDGAYRVVLYDKIAAKISGLRRCGIRTALVTNNDRRAFAAYGPDIDLDELFDVTVFSSDVPAPKPDAGILLYTLKCLDVDAAEAVLLDDIAVNVDAAVRIGMQGVVVESPDAVTDIIERLQSAL